MNRLSRNAIGLLFAAAFCAPACAQSTLIPPPYDGSRPPPKIAVASQALATLHQHGISDIRRFGRVGDYWEAEGTKGGKPVIAYVFATGVVEVKPANRTMLRQAFGALPRFAS
jgi:hypothetical protein